MSFEFRDNMSSSDSARMGSEFGKKFAEGMGVGLSDSSYYAITAMENVYVELETLTKNAAKNAEKLEKKRQERQLSNLKNSLKLELICEQEYYEKLKEFRDENFRQGSDMWYKCTEEIAAYNKRLIDETQKQYEKILSLRDELSEKLKGKEPWADSTKIRFIGMGENGQDLVYSNTELNNFKEEILLLEHYRDTMKKLEELKEVPSGVFEDIGKMNIQKGLEAANAILLADEKTRNEFFEGYKTHENLAVGVANDLLGVFNSRSFAEQGIYANSDLGNGHKETENDFIEILKTSFDEVPKQYFDLGNQAGVAFERGFLSKIPEVMENTKNHFALAINDIAQKLSTALKIAASTASCGIQNSYQTTYTFNSSRDTTTQQLNAARNAATLNRLRGGTDI